MSKAKCQQCGGVTAIAIARAERDVALDALRALWRELDNGLAVKLAADVQPGHCDYISKKRAGMWCEELANEIHRVMVKLGDSMIVADASCQLPVASCQGVNHDT